MRLRAMLWKDARREWRGKEAAQAGLVLVGLFYVVFVFGLRDASPDPRVSAIVLWMPILFAAAAVSGRGLATESDRGTMELLRSAPVPLVTHGLSRTLIDLAVGALVSCAALALAWALLAVPVGGALVAVLTLGLLGIGVVGTLAGGLAAQARARELLLPVLMVPLLSPLLLAGLEGTLRALRDGGELGPVLLIMAGYDLVMAGLAWIAWPFILEGD